MTKYSVPQASEELGAAVRPALPGAPPLAAGAEASPGAAAHVLRRARALIAEKGWTQRATVDSDGRRCAMGGIIGAKPGSQAHHKVCSDFLRAAAGIPPCLLIVDWNDAPERTKEEVLAAFDKAIALARRDAPQDTPPAASPEGAGRAGRTEVQT